MVSGWGARQGGVRPVAKKVRCDRAPSRAGAQRGAWACRPLSPVCALLALVGALTGPLAAQRPTASAGPVRVSAAAPRAEVDCLKCHSLPNLGYRDGAGAPLRSFTVARGVFHASAHGKLACRQCHVEIDSFPHPPAAQRAHVTCDRDCHAVDSAGRTYTHAQIAAEFRESVHGDSVVTLPTGATRRGVDPDDPTCLTCHGGGEAHAIVPVAKVTRAAKMALCVRCHDDRAMMERHGVSAEAVTAYRRSFHYKAVRFGVTGTAICIDCHTTHHILPATDVRASIAPAALTKTCGQKGCHAGAQRNFSISGANHLDLRVEREPLLWFEEKFFLLLTGGTMLMLLVGIVLDVQRKFGWVVLARRAACGLARGGRGLARLHPALARSGRRGLRLARQLLID